MLTQRSLILSKEEVTKGTDPTPSTDSNASLVYGLDIAVNGEKLERDPFRTSLSRISHLIGKKWAELIFITELKGSGTAGTAPREDALFLACGLAKTTSTQTVTYLPASSSLKTCTIYAYVDGLLHIISYCVGSVKFLMEAGQTPKAEWTMRGLYAVPTDIALPSAATYDGSVPYVVMNSAFSIFGYTPVAKTLEIDMNNAVAEKPDVNTADGIKGFEITNRNVMGSFSPEAVLRATHDFWDNWANSTSGTLSIALNKTTGNNMAITAPAMVHDSIAYGDSEGIRTTDIPFSLALSSGDDEFKIEIT